MPARLAATFACSGAVGETLERENLLQNAGAGEQLRSGLRVIAAKYPNTQVKCAAGV